MYSPKLPYRIEVSFTKAVPSIGHVLSNGNDTLEHAKLDAERYKRMYQPNDPMTVTISRNKATYPSFDWEVVEKYTL